MEDRILRSSSPAEATIEEEDSEIEEEEDHSVIEEASKTDQTIMEITRPDATSAIGQEDASTAVRRDI